jgi:chromosome segregation ATPase
MTDYKNDYLEQANKSKADLEKVQKVIASSSAEALGKIAEAANKSKNLDATLTAVKSLRTELENSKKDFNKLQTALQSQVNEIKKIERSRYQILVHHGSTDVKEGREQNIAQLRGALYDKGYIVGADDIFNVSADKQEIIYYSDTMDVAAKVNEIINALPDQYKPIKPKLETSGNNDPYQVVIKLCPNGTASGNNCKNH